MTFVSGLVCGWGCADKDNPRWNDIRYPTFG